MALAPGNISARTHLGATEWLRDGDRSERMFSAHGALHALHSTHHSPCSHGPLFSRSSLAIHLTWHLLLLQLRQISRRSQCYPADRSQAGDAQDAQQVFGCASNDSVLVTSGCEGWLFLCGNGMMTYCRGSKAQPNATIEVSANSPRASRRVLPAVRCQCTSACRRNDQLTKYAASEGRCPRFGQGDPSGLIYSASSDNASVEENALVSASQLNYSELKATVGLRNLSIHIGAHFNDLQTNGTDFFVAFDPRWPMSLRNSTLTLPFAVAVSEEPRTRPFYVSKRRTCSSLLRVSNVQSRKAYIDEASLACDRFAKSVPATEWIAWENRARKASQLSMVGPGSCFECQSRRNIMGTDVLPTISLRSLVEGFKRPVKRLHIDAQGTDVNLLFSLGRLIETVSEIKIECQLIKFSSNGWMYQTPPEQIPNNCSAAVELLRGRGFEHVRLQMNNCGCEEYVLWACRSESQKCGRKQEWEWNWL